MRGLDVNDAAAAASQEDDKFYVKRLKEIVECPPNKGPPYSPTRLAPHLYIGSQRNADDASTLTHLGITHVLCCTGSRRADFKSPYSRDVSLHGYLTIPAEDHEDFNIMRYFPEAVAFLDEVKACRGRALVHCNLGVNRSGAVCAAYLMADGHMGLLEAVQYLKTKRAVVLYNRGFRRQLLRFARNRGYVDPIIQTNFTDQSYGKESNMTSFPESKLSMSLPRARSRDPSPVSMRSVGANKPITRTASTESDTSAGRKPLKFGARLFKRYGRSLSNNDVEKVSKDIKTDESSPTPSHRSLNGAKKSDGKSIQASRSSTLQPPETTNEKERLMDSVPEHLPLEKFGMYGSRNKSSRDVLSSMEKHADLVASHLDTGFSTSLLPGTRPKVKKTMAHEAEDDSTLSTSRPLRVYRRSATDSEVYRSKRQAAAAAAATSGPHKHSPHLQHDRLSHDMNALSIRSRTLPSASRTTTTPRSLLEIPKPRMCTLDFS